MSLPYSGKTIELADGKHTVTGGAYKGIGMDGRSVYKFATREVPRVLSEALANAGLTVDDVDHLLLHQANIRIMETVAQRLGIDFDKGRLGMSSLDGRLPYGQLTVQQPSPL